MKTSLYWRGPATFSDLINSNKVNPTTLSSYTEQNCSIKGTIFCPKNTTKPSSSVSQTILLKLKNITNMAIVHKASLVLLVLFVVAAISQATRFESPLERSKYSGKTLIKYFHPSAPSYKCSQLTTFLCIDSKHVWILLRLRMQGRIWGDNLLPTWYKDRRLPISMRRAMQLHTKQASNLLLQTSGRGLWSPVLQLSLRIHSRV